MVEVDTANNNEIDSSNIDALESLEAASDADLQVITKGLITEQMSNLKNRITSEIEDLKERQKRIRFMHAMQRTINSKTDDEGALDLTSPEIQGHRQRTEELLKQAEELDRQAEVLESEGKTAAAKSKRENAMECRDVAHAMTIQWDKKALTKEEKERLLDSLRMTCDDLNAFVQIQTQTINRLNNELHESLLLGRDVMKRIHEILVQMGRGIRGN